MVVATLRDEAGVPSARTHAITPQASRRPSSDTAVLLASAHSADTFNLLDLFIGENNFLY